MTFDGQVLLPAGMGSVSDADIFVAILDSTGQVLHVKRFGGHSYDYCFYLLTTNDGSIYLSGDFYSPDLQIDGFTLSCDGGGKFGRPDALLLKLDSTLQPVWAKQVSGFGIQRGMVVQKDALDRIYWGFEFTNYQSYLEEDTLHGGLDNAMICRLDADGNILWRRSFASATQVYLVDLSFDSDSNFWLVAAHRDSLKFESNTLLGAGAQNYTLVKMSPGGAFLRWLNIPGTSSESIDQIQAIGNQQLFVVGGADSLSFLNLYIAAEERTYFHFILDLNTVNTQHVDQQVIGFSIFPNPVSAGGLLQVKLMGIARHAQVILSDALGRLVGQAEVPEYTSQMTFPAPRRSGLYYLTLKAGEQYLTQKIVVGP